MVITSTKKEVIYDLRLDIKNPDVPFAVQRSIGVQSGNLIEVFSRFQVELVKLLKELHEEELRDAGPDIARDEDIPF